MKYFSKRDASDYEPKCLKQDTAVDQAHYYNNNSRSTRSKRFVLFPEFINYLDDWRYIHRPQQFIYWIANFYPNKINTDDIHRYIKTIIQQINSAIDQDIIVQEASNPGEANFHFNFFDYTKCPMDDIPEANVDNILVLDELFIYPPEVTKQNRYRAHGGIHLIEDDRPISTIKLNMQHKFLVSNDFVYEPTIYACTEDEEDCEIDLYYVLLHETLHGFGIEHTTNAQQPTPPNPHMQSVMHFSPVRLLCHDDIRAIRMVYNLPVKRQNAHFDDTCRRDFPMNKLQRLMFLIGRILIIFLLGFFITSLMTFILTLLYLLVRYLYQSSPNQLKSHLSTTSKNSWFRKDKKLKMSSNSKPRAYLWHDEML